MGNLKGSNHPFYGKHLSDEHKAKISKALTGHKASVETKAKITEAVRGRKHSEESKIKISEAKKGTCTGSSHHNWQGGISFEPYSPEFTQNLKDMVRERDGYICQLCGKTQREEGKKLSVHHIDYDKKNCSMNNPVALCNQCHTVVNFNRNDWTDYFKEIL